MGFAVLTNSRVEKFAVNCSFENDILTSWSNYVALPEVQTSVQEDTLRERGEQQNPTKMRSSPLSLRVS
ncbi:MAG: hypothetical protein NC299_03275, partial [Lachnospiraceae bacterium]|nr:hypothetical protein [Lachnospiraceae bacterium]